MRLRAAGFIASAARRMSAGRGARQAADHRPVLGELLRDRLHALEVADGGDGEAGLHHVDAELGQRLGHAQLLLEVHGEAGRLLAVAQRGVEDDDAVVVQGAEGGMGDGHVRRFLFGDDVDARVRSQVPLSDAGRQPGVTPRGG
jgi:hypothetical protein